MGKLPFLWKRASLIDELCYELFVFVCKTLSVKILRTTFEYEARMHVVKPLLARTGSSNYRIPDFIHRFVVLAVTILTNRL